MIAMRQHVNPLSKHFNEVEKISPLNVIFSDPQLPLHIDIGSASGEFLFKLAFENDNWNYLGIEIREKLVNKAKERVRNEGVGNLSFAFGNAFNIFNHYDCRFLITSLSSISFNFPDPWFKKKHNKRRVIQPKFINLLSSSMKKESLIFIKTDIKELFDYMDFTILSDLNFEELNKRDLNYFQTFNPKKLRTNREKHAILNQLNIFEKIYIKI